MISKTKARRIRNHLQIQIQTLENAVRSIQHQLNSINHTLGALSALEEDIGFDEREDTAKRKKKTERVKVNES